MKLFNKSSHKEHEGREEHKGGRGGSCPKVICELHDKIANKNP